MQEYEGSLLLTYKEMLEQLDQEISQHHADIKPNEWNFLRAEHLSAQIATDLRENKNCHPSAVIFRHIYPLFLAGE